MAIQLRNEKLSNMKCKQYIENLPNRTSWDNLTAEEKNHIGECAKCEKSTQNYFSFFLLVDKEKRATVSPFISTRIMAKLQNTPTTTLPRLQAILLNTAVIVFTLLLGFMSAYFLDENREANDQEQLISQYFSSTSTGLNLEDNWLNKELYEE